MQLFVLELVGEGALAGALERVQDAPQVESCAVERAELRLLFVASPKLGMALVERVYLEGGLRWCTRHELASPGARVVALDPGRARPPRR